jgi:hypothetical protein
MQLHPVMQTIGVLPTIPPLRSGAENEPTQRIHVPEWPEWQSTDDDAPALHAPPLYKVLLAFAALGALFAWVRALRRRAHAS